MSTLNYCTDMELTEAKEKIAQLEGELAREKEWTEKLRKMLREDYKSVQKARKERDEVREILREIASARGFDNIGEWARNKARKALKEI